MAQIGSFTRDDDGVFTGTIRTLNINTKATIRPVAKDNERSPRLPGHRQRRRVRRGLEQGGQGHRRRIPLAQARRSLLHRPGLRDPGPKRQGRAQAHLVALTDPRRLATSEAPRPLIPRDYAERQHGKTRQNARLQPRHSA